MTIALITGGTGGMGQASAQRLARDGVTIVVADLDAEAAATVAAGLPGSGHIGLGLDVTDEQAVATAFSQVEQTLGPVSILVLFAGMLGREGVAPAVPLMQTSVANWEAVFRVNVLGTYICVREMARRRDAHPVQNGRIITISSSAAQMGPNEGGPAYAASKGAVASFTKSAARSLGRLGITVNTIAPGPIDTVMLRDVMATTPREERDQRLKALPAGRVGYPDDIAAAVSYLASAECGFVTGTTLDVNGGLHMH